MTGMNTTRIYVAVCAATSLLASGAPAAVSKAAEPSYLHPVVPFIEDDYDRALAKARTGKLPLFIEAWAPW